MSLSQQSGQVPSGQYDAFRSNGFSTYYNEVKTAWQADVLESGIIFAICILALAFFSILPGIHGKQRLFTSVWIVVSLFIGAVILVTNFSQDWESSSTQATTKYKAGTGKDIKASIGVHIGLRGINITLKGEPVHQLNETINYNEEFSWSWRQGRLGFGPFASDFNQEYRAAQFRGLPLPILWIAEYFTLDGEGIRWGRLYRESGLYAHMLLWLAFPLWLLSNILFLVLLRYGAYFLILTGTSMCTANIIKACLRNTLELTIPFSATHILVFRYGSAFWLCLLTGCLCILCGTIILIMDLNLPAAIAKFFGVDVRQIDYEIFKEDLLNRSMCTRYLAGCQKRLKQTWTKIESVMCSKPSQSSHRPSSETSKSADTDLLEIVEVDSDGNVSKTSDVRTETSASLSLSEEGNDADWTDYTSESELDPTDDEFEEREVLKSKSPNQLFERFQSPRPKSSGNPALRNGLKATPGKPGTPFKDTRKTSPISIGFRTRSKLSNGKVSPLNTNGSIKKPPSKRF